MMHDPMLMVALAGVAVLAALVFFTTARKRRLRLRIEPVPPERLDTSEVRSEILSEVRVRERGQADTATDLPIVEREAEGASVDLPPSVDSSDVEPVVTPVSVADSPKSSARLSQADLFPDEPEPAKSLEAESGAAPLAIDRVYSVHVMAGAQQIPGRRLLELLLQFGLRYGDMQIFHRHEHPAGQGDILFSMAQAIEPGTFNIENLERDLVPGVSFFMSLPGVKSTLAYDLMVDTARRLAQELHADLLDAESQPLTPVTLEFWRDEVVAYERRQLSAS